MDLEGKIKKRQTRFRRPDFQSKLARARRYSRRSEPVNKRPAHVFLNLIGLRSWITRLLSLFLLLCLAYFLMVADTFLITQVKVSDKQEYSEKIYKIMEDMSRERDYLIPRNHILFLNQNYLLSVLQKELPEIRRITRFEKRFPNQLTLEMEHRNPTYIWQTRDDIYFLDQDGVVFRPVLDDPLAEQLPYINDSLGQEVSLGEHLDIGELLSFVNDVTRLWPERVSDVAFTTFSVPAIQSYEVIVHTDVGFVVIFDLLRPAGVQLIHLNLLLQREIPPETLPGLSYIDLRIPTTAFYCYKDAPCALEKARDGDVEGGAEEGAELNL